MNNDIILLLNRCLTLLLIKNHTIAIIIIYMEFDLEFW